MHSMAAMATVAISETSAEVAFALVNRRNDTSVALLTQPSLPHRR